MNEQKDREMESSFQEFTSQALRLHRRGSFENLLCQHLMTGVAANPLMKIRLVCEAGWMVDTDKIGLDLKQVENEELVRLIRRIAREAAWEVIDEHLDDYEYKEKPADVKA